MIGGIFEFLELTPRGWVPRSWRHNVVLTQAAAYLGDVMRQADEPIGAMAIGDDATTPLISDTGLGHEIARGVIPAPGTNTTDEKNIRSGDLWTVQVRFTGINGWIREVGLVGGLASPPGALGSGLTINRALVGPYFKSPSDVFAFRLRMVYG